jgi:hypothetical protein
VIRESLVVMNFNPPLIKVSFVRTHEWVLDIFLLLDGLN